MAKQLICFDTTYPISQRAYLFAEKKHKPQFRRSGEPYLKHCERVAQTVLMHSQDDLLVSVALLHDTLEDTITTYDELLGEFGETIANMVLSLTNDKSLLKEMGKAEYLAQKVKNLPNDALLVKLCDRLDNVSDLCGVDDEWSRGYAQQTYYVFFDQLRERKLPSRLSHVLSLIQEIIVDYVK
jgi:GTP pyrophosphokinase